MGLQENAVRNLAREHAEFLEFCIQEYEKRPGSEEHLRKLRESLADWEKRAEVSTSPRSGVPETVTDKEPAASFDDIRERVAKAKKLVNRKKMADRG